MVEWSRRAALAGLSALPVAATAGPIADSANVERGVRGRYRLTVRSSGEVFGFEDFSVFLHPDGTRTLESRIVNNDVSLFRAVIYRVDARFRPRDCHLVLYKDGSLLGSAWVTVNEGQLTARANTMGADILHRVQVPEEFSLVPHAGASDGWHFWYLNTKAPMVEPATGAVYMMRVNRQTAVGLLGRLIERPIQFHGRETAGTPAGRFDCDVFTFGPPARLWVTGPDRLPVRLLYAQADREFLLEEYDLIT